MSHIAHLRKQFKSINTYYIITLIKSREKKQYLLYENLLVLHLKKLKSPSPKDALCKDWLKLAQWSWRRGFLDFVNVFSLIIFPWKRAGPFIWINLNLLHPKTLCAKFGWNWLSGSGEEDFFNFVNIFLLFRNYLPFKKGRNLHLTKLESPLRKDALFQM